MRNLSSIFENRVLWVAILAWLIAQLSKIIVVWIVERKLNLRRIVGAGGMPSSHSAFAVALATGVGFRLGFGAPTFALAAAFAMVVMYDAAGVRRAAGRQAQVLNCILKDLQQLIDEGTWPRGDHFQAHLLELVGHSPVEVLAGALVGLAVAVLLV